MVDGLECEFHSLLGDFTDDVVLAYLGDKVEHLVAFLLGETVLLLKGRCEVEGSGHVVLVLLLQTLVLGNLLQVLLVGGGNLFQLALVFEGILAEATGELYQRVLAVLPVHKEIGGAGVAAKHTGESLLPLLITGDSLVVIIVIVTDLAENGLIVGELGIGMAALQSFESQVALGLNFLCISLCHC